ncbi:conserved hypothetical protein [Bathymodiolus platifrons methanotrophic gill symbiont]|uniref:heme-binding protein n=1 Tax=Bathymodiolus platifrons methanotrophic gill symbiont TaxID=113268 RepID=UPI000B4075F0|nr:heme-binding protein [Bathymodiolus platifrons methanotrophic gill symbiont]MCK5869353.1 heme-binding protein [Methyloprofundus sp.]TXK98260.1 hypothetical protein BMR10_03060 [Methylococcaceae bacterium CS4]TXK98447.1 hypothetical protein BMR11_08280 [Methylococcaceae bacterium CS5]TXL06302.1 hypothetical protein BMR09_08290 [Methylococcaceae bacterium CS3]TXL07304.1 hypothetical protein BMR07_05040 [Methylococcaceae bacterium CS1]TXL11159.1 hypothetical protein BMR08_05680 [Methylococcac
MIKPANFKKLALACAITLSPLAASAEPVIDICPDDASKTVIHDFVKGLLKAVQAQENGGFGFHMWANVVNRDGKVCAVVFSGDDRGDQWPDSRNIAAAKAYTANSLTLPGFSLSTANLYQPTQPGGSLWHVSNASPVDTTVAYMGPAEDFGTASDPMLGKVHGGLIQFGGGLGLYDASGKLIGGLGVSGSSSCEDHVIAWKVRHLAQLDYVPAGPSKDGDDNLTFMGGGSLGWEHPFCGVEGEVEAQAGLPAVRKLGE